MITHRGIRYWTTDELAASIEARDLVRGRSSNPRVRRLRAQQWAKRMGLAPAALTKRGGLLYRDEDVWLTLEEPNPGVSLAGR